MKPGFGVGMAAALALLFACHGSDDDGGGAAPSSDGPGTTRANGASLDELLGLLCDRLRSCCAQSGSPAEGFDDCESDAADDELFAAIRGGTAVLVDPGYSACIAQLRAASCDSTDNTDACGSFFQGTIAPGGACMDAVECERGSTPVVCLRAGGVGSEQPGVCRALRRAGAGEACVFSSYASAFGASVTFMESESSLTLAYCEVLSDGLFCSPAEHVCKPLVGEGEACEGQLCELDLYCDQTCKRRKPEGSACTDSEECATPALLCIDGQCAPPQAAFPRVCTGGLG
jgi:hypothetical protein